MIKGVATLSGDDLIWAMCRARGHAPVWAPTGVAYRSEPGAWVYPRYTSDSEAGELIARYAVNVERPSEQTGWQWRAAMEGVGGVEQCMLGETLGEAICRVIVLCRLGPEIKLPERVA